MLLKSLDKSELQAAFLAEESQRRRRPEGPGGDAVGTTIVVGGVYLAAA